MAQMDQYIKYVSCLTNESVTDSIKLKYVQEINKNLELIVNSDEYKVFLATSMDIFIRLLREGNCYFIGDSKVQQMRKLILEFIYRLPTNELLKPHVQNILSLTFDLLKVDNEKNVLVCLKIIIELHKQYREYLYKNDTHIDMIRKFLLYIKTIYNQLPLKMNKIFEPKVQHTVQDLNESMIEEFLQNTFTTTTIQLEGSQNVHTLIPKAIQSLNILQELPIVIVLMYRIFSEVRQIVGDFIPLIMDTITLRPTDEQINKKQFNKETFADFIGAQIKALSFLAYITKDYMEIVKQNSNKLVKGVLGLLELCPMEAAHLRRELLIAARHILATNLRNEFVPRIKCLFNEDILLGHGYTTHESLRPLAYSTLADLVQHVRQQLSLDDLSRAVHLFSKNLHDDSLPTIQTMSCKLLYNLVESIRLLQVDEKKTIECRKLLMRMLKVFVFKFKTIATIYLPRLIKKCNNDEQVVFFHQQSVNYNVNDYKSLVKSLVSGVKNITCVCSTTSQLIVVKPFQSHEIQIYIKLVRWALKAFDIYTLSNGPQPGSVLRLQQKKVRSEEEKEVLQNFSGIFSLMSSQNFYEIFNTTIEYLVERVAENPALQTIPNTLLVNSTSPTFATILVEYLLEHMDEMGTNTQRSDLYLGLFKLAVGSVSFFPTEIGNMLRPHLHQLINRSMDLAMRANDPYNYFLLLRALYRSIAKGKHDLLYLEFIPLLPNLLESLNHLQSGCHKELMKDVLVELCFVPLRLSSLLPYLHMLMDPLISALNLKGSDFFKTGLGILENILDTLRPDYLNELIQPFLPDLLQALWKILWNNDPKAQNVFRLLGKLGGCNRQIMYVPQKLDFIDEDYQQTTNVVIKLNGLEAKIELPVNKIIETSYNLLKQTNVDLYYKKQAWECIKSYLKCSGCILLTTNDIIINDNKIVENIKGIWYKSIDLQARKTHQLALTCIFFVASNKTPIDTEINNILHKIVKQYTVVAILQQVGDKSFIPKPNSEEYLDPLVLIDALVTIIGNDERNVCDSGYKALEIMLNTAKNLLGNIEDACNLPLIDYLTEQMCNLCYERRCYAKLGGCLVIKYLYENCSLKWLYEHIFKFVKAFLFVMMDLTGEVSCGAVDRAKDNLKLMLITLVEPTNKKLIHLQTSALNDVRNEFVRQINSPHGILREQAMESLRLLAEKQNISVTDVIRPSKHLLDDMVPPTKHLLKEQPTVAQLGLMDGITFCISLNPRLFIIDMSKLGHATFVNDVISICNTEDANLNEMSCYKTLTNFTPLRISAIRVLASLYYLDNIRNDIFNILFKSLKSSNSDLQYAAFECIKTFINGCNIDMNYVQDVIKSANEVNKLNDVRNLTITNIKLLLYLTQLFPTIFNEELCDQLLNIIKLLLNVLAIQKINYVSKQGDIEQKIMTLLKIFQHLNIATSNYIVKLCQLKLMEARLPFRDDLMAFLLRYPAETMDLFLNDNFLKDPSYNTYLEYILLHKNGKLFRDHLQINMIERLMELTINYDTQNEYKYQAIKIVNILIKYDDEWLSTNMNLIDCMQKIWCNDNYHEKHKNINEIDSKYWNEPKLLAKILLNYFRYTQNDYNLLFQLVRAFPLRLITDFNFLHDFLQNTVCHYTIEWKRCAFFKFVDLFSNDSITNELKAKVMQHILIPCFAVSFERRQTAKLIDANQNDKNIIDVFVTLLHPLQTVDCVRIALFQFACLLVDQAHEHINEQRLNCLQAYAGQYLQIENSVDPSTRYHAHLLLAHIISKFCVNQKIVWQCYCMLLKAHAIEARTIVCQALDIIIKSTRTDDDFKSLAHCTKKILVDEGHSTQQLYHTLQLIIKHHNIFYYIRNLIIQNMVTAIQKLSCGANASLEQKKLAVEFTEVVLKWALFHKKEHSTAISNMQSKRSLITDERQNKRIAFDNVQYLMGPSTSGVTKIKTEIKMEPGTSEQTYTDSILNFLLLLAFKISEPSQQNQQQITNGHGELLSKRCIALIQNALDPDNWLKPIDLKLKFLSAYLMKIKETNNTNLNCIYLALEFLTFALTVMMKDKIAEQYKRLIESFCVCAKSTDRKVIDLLTILFEKLFVIFPVPNLTNDLHVKQEQFHEIHIYGNVIKKELNESDDFMIGEQFHEIDVYGNVIKQEQNNDNTIGEKFIINENAYKNESFGELYIFIGNFIYNTLTTINNLQEDVNEQKRLLTCVKTLKAATNSNKTYIYDLMTPFMNIIEKLCEEDLLTSKHALIKEILIICLDLAKDCLIKMNVHVRKVFIEQIFIDIIKICNDVQVLKAVVRIVSEWIKKPTTENGPNLREKSILCLNLMHFLEKRFPNDDDLMNQFYDLILFIYTDQQYAIDELAIKLEAGFIRGLCCKQPTIRLKFVKLFNSIFSTMDNNVQNRLLYIISSKNWDAIGTHYFIKQCIELIFLTCPNDLEMQISNNKHKLPNLLNVETESVLSRDFLKSVIELCHIDSTLAQHLWMELFPKIWENFNQHEQYLFSREIQAFIQSTTNLLQQNTEPNAINTFIEALYRCKSNTVEIAPTIMVKLAKTHNLWHRMALELEKSTIDLLNSEQFNEIYYGMDVECTTIELVDSLSDLYDLLCEEDLWTCLWQKVAYYKETSQALAYEQFGYFEHAKNTYELAMEKHNDNLLVNLPAHIENEIELWDNHWIRCMKELNQWDILFEYAQNTENPYLLIDSVWRTSQPVNWDYMMENLTKIERNCVMEYRWKATMYKGYLNIFQQQNVDQTNQTGTGMFVEPISLCLKQWKKLPRIISHIHLEYLRGAQQILELQEFYQIRKEFSKKNNPFDNVKSMMKTWSNRLPTIADDLTHWNEILMWRQHFYKFIINYDRDTTSSMCILCRHARAQCNIKLSCITRKHKLPTISLNILNKFDDSNSDHDLFEKFRQQIKNYIQLATMNKTDSLNDAINIINHIEMKDYFNKDKMKSEFYALKGTLLQYIGNSDGANNSFSTAIKLFNSSSKACSSYGEYLENVFLSDRQMIYGKKAIKCFLYACRDQNESKARKYLAKVLWLLNYDDDSLSLHDALERYSYGVPPILWLPWIPQLITFILQSDNKAITNILCDVGRMFPQAVYMPLRPIYLTMKTASVFKTNSPQKQMENSTYEIKEIKATPTMKRFSIIKLTLMKVHTTVISCLDRIAEQMEAFKEDWHEKVLQQLRQGLIKCYAIAFEHRDSVNDAKITRSMLNFVTMLMSNFGRGFDKDANDLNQMKSEFEKDFDFKQSNSMRLHSLIFKLKKWIKILENHSKKRLQSILIEDECRFLSNFTLKLAEIGLPGEFLLPKDNNKFIRIMKFMCRIDIVQKYNVTARRLYILGHNGKIYPYLVAHNSSDSKREERILQLLRMLNLFLGKQKETSKRFIHCTLPKVVTISQRMRLVEDNPNSLSLLDIFKRTHRHNENEDPIYYYYQRLAIAQSQCAKVNQRTYKDILQCVQNEMVPKDVFKQWVIKTYPSATDYWQFRKIFTIQLSLTCFYEYVLHLTRLNPEMIYIHKDTGLMNISYFQFDVDNETGDLISNRPVPFRLTPNIVEFLPTLSMHGPLIACMIAAARCFVYPNFKFQSILRPILRDEMILLKQDDTQDIDVNNDKIIAMVNKGLSSIVGRLNSLATFDSTNSKAAILIDEAINHDNLCEMDPAWHPWL